MPVRIFTPVRRVLAGVLMIPALALAGTLPATAESQCMPRFIAQNIEDAVMAFTAARYCDGLPYTIAEASQRVDLMRNCNSDASAMIDGMLDGHDEEYRNIYTSDPTRVACQAAAAIVFN